MSAGMCEKCGKSRTSVVVQCVGRTAIHTVAIPFFQGEDCQSIHEILISCGFFPSSPERPRTVFSFEILESYNQSTAQSNYAVAPFRDGLIHGFRQRGYTFTTSEPWREQLPEALICSRLWHLFPAIPWIL
ncbi:hypothetical protein K439DRAFT_571807 [Ramaria rubella]|nr:hypothetical protein K439DRAFT_571807 [Ramaria rubella]